RGHALVGRAALEGNEIIVAAIVPIGRDQIAILAARRDAVAVDLAGEGRIDREDCLAQRLALDEVVRQLIERAVIVVVDARIALEHANQDFALDLVVTIVGKAGALADQDALGARNRNELIGDRDRLVEDVVKQLELAVEDEEEPHRRFVEDRADIGLVCAENARGRLHVAQVIELEHYAARAIGDAVDERLELLDLHAVALIKQDIGDRLLILPLREVHVIGEVDLALIAIDDVEPDIAGVADVIVREAEVIVVLGRIDFDA